MPPSASSPQLSQSDIRLIMIGLMGVMMLAALETAIIGPALPTIGRELGNADYLPWVVTSYLLVTTALTPLAGKIADIRGRRLVILAAAGAFLVGSVLCAVSTSMPMLIFARGIQGIGGGGIFAMTQTIIGDIVPSAERAKYQIYTSTVWLLANSIGPLLGGFLSEHWHWSMIFWINLPLGAVALAIVWPRLHMLPRNERPHTLDLLGSLLLIVATVLLMLVVSWGGSRFAWTSMPLLALAGAAITAWVLLVLRLLTAREPLIPLAVLNNQVVRMATLCGFSSIGAYVALAVYLPVYFQTLSGLSVSDAGIATIPLMAFTTLGAAIGAFSMRRALRYRIAPLSGLAASTLSLVTMALLAGAMPLWLILFLTAIVATGIGVMFPLAAVSLQAAVARHDLGSTMALLVFLRSLGQSLGVAAVGAVLIGIAGADAIKESAVLNADMIADLKTAFSYMFGISAAGFGASLFFLWRMEDRPLQGYGRYREAPIPE